MMDAPLFYRLPIFVLFLGTIILSLACIEGGRRLGGVLNRKDRESSGSIGSAVGATLGLLAFILAFTFSVASTRYDARKQLVTDGANAIGTCYLRADFLPDEQRIEAQRLLREWVALRIDRDSFGSGNVETTLSQANEIQSELWDLVVVEGRARATPMTALFADACNEVFDVHSERVTKGLVNRIPGPLWLVLYVVSMLAMVTVGYQLGTEGSRRGIGMALLAVAFATVLVTIADLDDGFRGFLRVSNQPMELLYEDIEGE